MPKANSDSVSAAIVFTLLLLVTCLPYMLDSMSLFYIFGGTIGGSINYVIEAIGLDGTAVQIFAVWGTGLLILLGFYWKATSLMLRAVLFTCIVPVSYVLDFAFALSDVHITDDNAMLVYAAIGLMKSICLSALYYFHPVVRRGSRTSPV